MSASRVLLVEDDPQMAELLTLLIGTAAPGTEVDWFTDVATAEAAFSAQRHRLVISDWNLPGKPGITLLPAIRRQLPRVPVLMITGRTDRASVIAARQQGADGFIAKPFQVERVVARLGEYLRPEAATFAYSAAPELMDFLARLPDASLDLPVMGGIQASSTLGNAESPPDLRELAAAWETEPGLSARLIAMANSSLYNPQGKLCSGLLEALSRLGWRTAVNVATALALRQAGGSWSDPRLAALATEQLDLGERVAEQAAELARQYRIDPAPCQTAALLHRLGELCVLFQLQEWQLRFGGTLDDAQPAAAVSRFSRDFSDRLKSRWRYPMPLRELIGAIYALPPGTTRREKFLLRLAGGLVYGSLQDGEEARLRRLAEG